MKQAIQILEETKKMLMSSNDGMTREELVMSAATSINVVLELLRRAGAKTEEPGATE